MNLSLILGCLIYGASFFSLFTNRPENAPNELSLIGLQMGFALVIDPKVPVCEPDTVTAETEGKKWTTEQTK